MCMRFAKLLVYTELAIYRATKILCFQLCLGPNFVVDSRDMEFILMKRNVAAVDQGSFSHEFVISISLPLLDWKVFNE